MAGDLIQKIILKVATLHSGMALCLLVIFCLPLVLVPEADAWWDGKWKQRIKVQFDTTAAGANIRENLTDVPALVRLHAGNFSFFEAKSDGSDLRFIAFDDKTPLKHHIEKFDADEEIALVWVKAPRIAGGSAQDFFWLYFGNESAPDAQDARGTYDVNTVAVYHLNEEEGLPNDSTAYANNAAKFEGKLQVPAIIGPGAQFDGEGAKMMLVESPSLNFNKGFTFSAWVRPLKAVKDAHILSWADGRQSLIIGIDENRVFCSINAGKGQTETTPKTAEIAPGQWKHLGVTIDPSNRVTIYLNGEEVISSKIKSGVPAPDADLFIGAAAKGGSAFAGDIDEIHLSNSARLGDWMKAAFQGQGPDGKLITCLEGEGSGESEGSLAIHLMKVIIRTITLDGWLIIGILAIMDVLSFIVFSQKMISFRKSKKANQVFAEQFRKSGDPLLLQGKEEEQGFADSTFYRIYKSGCDELNFWMNRKGGESIREGRGLAGTAMNGFKAALDKASMFENRLLSSGMFILNMSVAGGPFLGLLGTVWGVMNTFASLAEAGEASLTAIAPGVASALACTLAGLLVAIPALFASIFLTGRIKDMMADMSIFIDEFILRMEEDKGEKS